MRAPLPLLHSVIALLAGARVFAAESEVSYEDLRVQAGSMCNNGEQIAFTFMAGDLGDKDQGVVDIGTDFGFVLGVRGVIGRAAATVEVVNSGPDIALNVLGGEVLGGLGYYLGKNDILEFLVGLSLGVSSETGQTALNHRDGSYSGYTGEIGWYHTIDRTNFVLGLVVAAERIHNTLKLQSGDDFPVRAQGFDVTLAFGYRFH
jgi:hypothetical protein